MVLVDAAKGSVTEPPDLSRYPSDFTVISFYKVNKLPYHFFFQLLCLVKYSDIWCCFIKLFGYPTGLGALIVKTGMYLTLRVYLCMFHILDIAAQSHLTNYISFNTADAAKLLKKTYFSGGILCSVGTHAPLLWFWLIFFANCLICFRDRCSLHSWHRLCQKERNFWGFFWRWNSIVFEHCFHQTRLQNS